MRLLTGPSSAPTGELTDVELLDLYALDDAAPRVRANMLTSLDGRTSGADSRSGSLSTPADRRIFSILRSLCDVIVVGAGTARAEGYRLPRVADDLIAARSERGRRRPPILAIVSNSLKIDAGDPLFVRDRTLLITSTSAEERAVARAREVVDVIQTPGPDVDLAHALSELRERGMPQVLTEGGPTLLASAMLAGVIDELCLTIVPVVLGGDGHRLLGGTGAIDAHFRLEHLIEADGTLLTRYMRSA